MTARSSFGKAVLLIAALTVLTLWATHRQLLESAASWLNVATFPQRTDYVFVLNGDSNVRPFIAAALVKAGLASQVLLVPMKEPHQSESSTADVNAVPASHELARRVLIHQGVAAERIRIIAGKCTNTFDEAQSLFNHLNNASDQTATVSIVTSDFHTRRTRWTYQQVFGDRADRLSFVAAPTEGFDQTNWWRVEDGFMVYGTEFLKFGFYTFRYGNGWWVCGGTMAFAVTAVVFRRLWRQHSDRLEPACA